ncbi:MAG: phage portal protein [Deltaproteobacteria bacterium]|nr:MAG: phage portal protein [Deltaproteobacteria bacterium]
MGHPFHSKVVIMFKFFKRKKREMDLSEFSFGIRTAAGQLVTEQSAMAIPAVFACVRVLAESCGSLPLIVYERKPDGTKRRAREFGLYKLLHDAPNPYMDAVSFFELMVGHCALRGNAYAKVERNRHGEVIALWPLLPQNMVVKVDDGQLIYSYTHNGVVQRYEWQDIFHLKGLTHDGVIGVSPLSLLRETIGRAQAQNDYSARFFSNDASPGGVLEHPQHLSNEALARLRRTWEAKFKQNNAHTIAILEDGMSFKSVGISPEDSQMIDSQKFSVVEIARAFRVPLNLIQDHERSTYSNVTEQNRSFVVHTLTSWLTRVEQACNRVLLTEQEKERYFCEFLLDSLLRGDQKTRYECYEIGLNAGFLSRNDVRKYENLSPIPGGDDYARSGGQQIN